MKVEAFLCFIGLEKAFNRLEFKDVLNILEENNVLIGLILLISDIFTDNFNRIRVDGKMSEKIPIRRGVRQGDSLSPLLFNLIMN